MIINTYFEHIGLKESLSPKIYGHPIPFGNYLDKPAYKNILLVGDAAGLADSISGEGIFYAQRSGELATYVIKNINENNSQSVSDSYIEKIQEYVHPEMSHSKKSRPLT